MSDRKFIETSAKTIEDAIAEGLAKLDLSIGDVDVEILEEGSKGLFGLFGSKQAKVRLTAKESVSAMDMLDSLNIKKTAKNLKEKNKSANELAENNKKSLKTAKKECNCSSEEHKEQKSEECNCASEDNKEQLPFSKKAETKAQLPEQEKKPSKNNAEQVAASEVDKAEMIEKSKEFLSQLTKYMGVDVSITPSFTDEQTLFVDMHGDELGILIGRHGETLDALQHITKLAINKGNDDFLRILLDSENYRQKREESLIRLANRMANRAIKTGRRVSLEPMNPYERRIIHSALQKNDQVSTHSEGEEPRRHLVITIKQK